MAKTRNKIAFIHPDLGIGGAERLVLDVAGALKKQNHDVFFITNHFDKSHAFEDLKNGEFCVQVYGDWLPRSIFGKFQALCAYIRMVYLTIFYILFHERHDKPDVYFIDLIPVAIPILKVFNCKIIYYCHHPDLLSSTPGGQWKTWYRKPINWIELQSTALADLILVNSKYTASVFRDTFPEIRKSLQVLYPTVAYSYQEAVAKLTPKTIKTILPDIPSQATTVFLSINRFHPAKKLDLAINALAHLKNTIDKEEFNNIFLIIAGGYDPYSVTNANYYSELTNLAEDKELKNQVLFLRSPSDDLKAELLLACDCLIYTPIKEHFGIVPLEAMTVGKPVIACDSGGPRETVSHGTTGYLCEPNPASLAKFMYKMLDKTSAKEMGLKGKIELEKKFSYNSFANSLGEILRDFNKKFV